MANKKPIKKVAGKKDLSRFDNWLDSVWNEAGSEDPLELSSGQIAIVAENIKLLEGKKAWKAHVNDFLKHIPKEKRKDYEIHFDEAKSKSSDFENYKFPCSVDFNNVEFSEGSVDFSRAEFNEHVSFADTNFGGGYISFFGAEFSGGSVDFSRAEFNGYVSFADTNFGGGYISFFGAKFGDDAVDFNSAKFGDGELNFSYCEFGEGEKSFFFAEIFNLTAVNADLSEADFTDAQLGAERVVYDEEGEETLRQKPSIIDFTGAKLHHAIINQNDLSNAIGLEAATLGGADITSAKLPTDIKEFHGLKHVESVSKHARNIFLMSIGACIFSWISLSADTIDPFLNASADLKVPFLNMNIDRVAFIEWMPLLLSVLYIYLHLYLERMWDALSTLPAIFTDGRTLEQRAYPWMLTSLLYQHMPLLKGRERPMQFVSILFSYFLAWGVVPITMIYFWSELDADTETHILLLHNFLIAGVAGVGVSYYRVMNWTLRKLDTEEFSLVDKYADPIIASILVFIAMMVVSLKFLVN
ncbi:MAG: pentapeptide repeat-containing protein [Sphingomonadales bacterium]|nr:pentapeptide repeat-containing protein [Sphingomonadales bacterium]